MYHPVPQEVISGWRMNRNAVRSVGAVCAGALAGIVLSVGTDELLRAAGIFPGSGRSMRDSLYLLAAAYRTIYGVAGAYICARLAPSRPMLHALILGSLGLAASTVGAVVTWQSVPSFGPHWYPLTLIVLALPPAWLGAKLRLMELRRQAPGL
jgi:hypothetical protein